MRLLAVATGLSLMVIAPTFGATADDFLILQDIGRFRLDQPEKVFPGEPPIGGPRQFSGPGILGGAGHFQDHEDRAYEVMYIGGSGLPSPTVQVIQHAGGDSDRWLLHEVEDAYRDGDVKALGLLTEGAVVRKVENQRVFWIGLGGGSFMWLSNNMVISISYTDLQGSKPEPLEVVKAYLALHPSTITLTDAELKSSEHSVKWIKDEMERRLWLVIKWMGRFPTTPAPDQRGILRQVADHLEVFLKYREKYYGFAAKNDVLALDDLLRRQDATGIQGKIDEFQKWWMFYRVRPFKSP